MIPNGLWVQVDMCIHISIYLKTSRRCITMRPFSSNTTYIYIYIYIYIHNPNIQDREHYRTKCVPLDLHFDAIPVTAVGRKSAQSAIAYSWKSLLSHGSPTMLRMLIGFLWKSMVCAGAGAAIFIVGASS